MLFCRLLFFFKSNVFEKLFQEYHQSVNDLDPNQAKRFVGPDFVGPDLGLNCLQGYEQTTLVGKELIVHEIMVLIA